jgi:hypothetical protein
MLQSRHVLFINDHPKGGIGDIRGNITGCISIKEKNCRGHKTVLKSALLVRTVVKCIFLDNWYVVLYCVFLSHVRQLWGQYGDVAGHHCKVLEG